MKKRLVALVLLCLTLGLTGCSPVKSEVDFGTDSMFVIVEETPYWKIVYHKDTKVMYATCRGYDTGVFTLLVNADGTPQLWEEPKIDKRIISPTMK